MQSSRGNGAQPWFVADWGRWHDHSCRNLKAVQVANIVDCHERTIRRLCSNKRLFGNVKASLGKGGPPRSLNPVMVKNLCDHLLGKPNLYLYEMAGFIWNVFEKEVTCCPWAQLLRKRCTCILSNTPIPPSPPKKKKKADFPFLLSFVLDRPYQLI